MKTKIEQLEAKLSLYKTLCKQNHMDVHGFILTDECDSLLFSGLLGTAMPVDLTAAIGFGSRWLRRPLKYPECFACGSSASSISRDMFIGVLWYIWRNKKLYLAEMIYEYGKQHSWIMGEGDISRTYFTPGLQATLCEIIYRLGGKNYFIRRHIPQWTSKNTGYRSHLDILHLLLREELTGEVNKKIVKHQVDRQPNNPLFHYANKDYDKAMDILLDSRLWPPCRLPTTRDRKAEWLLQRDFGPDWEPLNYGLGHEHTGGDFIFLAHLVLERVK